MADLVERTAGVENKSAVGVSRDEVVGEEGVVNVW